MKALLVCPEEQYGVHLLAESAPLTHLSMLGKEFIAYWMEYLATRGANEIQLVASDRPDLVRTLVGDGSRWGVKAEVISCHRGHMKGDSSESGLFEPVQPDEVHVADHWPGVQEYKLFTSYFAFFQTLKKCFSIAAASNRIGLHEIQPGIWAGLHSRISPTAKLIVPCWISDDVRVEKNATIGPMAILESRVIIGAEAIVTNSLVAQDTYVGEWTLLKNSIAQGNTMINWENNHHTRIADPFLLCSLTKDSPSREPRLLERLRGWLTLHHPPKTLELEDLATRELLK